MKRYTQFLELSLTSIGWRNLELSIFLLYCQGIRGTYSHFPHGVREPEVCTFPHATREPEVCTFPHASREPEVCTFPHATREPEVGTFPHVVREPEVCTFPHATREPAISLFLYTCRGGMQKYPYLPLTPGNMMFSDSPKTANEPLVYWLPPYTA
jgi:hypothetical protein